MGGQTLLDKLRGMGQVDCDTFDVDVAKTLGPFVDCTSNQAIAYHELSRITTSSDNNSKTRLHEDLILRSATLAKSLTSNPTSAAQSLSPEDQSLFHNIDNAELAVEIMMVNLALRIVPYLTGYSHIQTNPKYSYSTPHTIANGRRIIALFTLLAPASSSSYDAHSRVCIKIPATWEGIQACRVLETQFGISTLATTMFCKEQAVLAAHVGECRYIAPYINELRVHFDAGYIDQAKAFGFSGAAQAYYDALSQQGKGKGKEGKVKTEVLPASLTSIQEVMQLAGSHHITVSPPLLQKLAETAADPWEDIGITGSALRCEEAEAGKGWVFDDRILEDEAMWRLAFTRSGNGKAEGKIIQAVNIFCEKQEGLEEIARGVLG